MRNSWSPPVLAAAPTPPVLVAAAGLVVVLAILLVFWMVLRSNGSARKTASGLGYDAQQGPFGEPQSTSRPMAPGARGPQGGWSDGADYGAQQGGQGAGQGWGAPAAGQGWGAPAAGQMGGAQGGGHWGDPAQQMGGVSAWESTPAGQQPGWGNAPAAGQAWGAPQQPAAGQGWGTPSAPSGQGWGAPQQQQPQQPLWDMQPSAPPWGAQQDAGQGGWGQQQGAGMGGVGGVAGVGGMSPTNAQGWGAQQQQPQGDWGAQQGGFGDLDRTRIGRPAGPSAQQQRVGVVVVRQGKEPGRTFEVRKDRLTIGRSRDSDIFLEDLAVSRLHTTLNRDESGRVILRDENSANGSFVNGQRVSEHVLEEGDEIQVGQTILAFVRR